MKEGIEHLTVRKTQEKRKKVIIKGLIFTLIDIEVDQEISLHLDQGQLLNVDHVQIENDIFMKINNMIQILKTFILKWV